ncbi:MAG: family 78 glycoside hydrolase catalytic domain [Phycisphaerae bacterium]
MRFLSQRYLIFRTLFSAMTYCLGVGFMVVVVGALASCTQNRATPRQLNATAAPIHLQTQLRANPLAINSVRPQLGWVLPWKGRGQFQAAYQILVASSPELLAANTGNLWNSGQMLSDQSMNVHYQGATLRAGQRCFWKVRVWNQAGDISHWSQAARWQEGLLARSNWKHAQWIGEGSALVATSPHPAHLWLRQSIFGHQMVVPAGPHPTDALPATYLRDAFKAPKTIKRAVVYVCGLGYSRLFINGKSASDDYLSPDVSWYPKRAYYRTYNVTRLLRRGKNVIGVILGDGRFYAPRLHRPILTYSFGPPMLLLRLHIRFSDGSTANIVTNSSWKMTDTRPLRADDIYDGDIYDARMEMHGWDAPGYHPAAPRWSRATIVPGLAKTAVLKSQFNNSIRITRIIHPKKLVQVAPGKWIFDMGQNMVGWCQITVPKGSAGTEIFLRHGESLERNGKYTVNLTPRGKGRIHLFVANLRSATQTDELILNGKGSITWHPIFTYHGFRFVELNGYPGTPTRNTIEGMEVVNALPRSGSFTCSDKLVNQIIHNCRWGTRNNYCSIPTDCPQRDERQGWMGDRSEESKGEAFMFNNERFYEKWLWDMQDAQRPDGSIADVNPPYWQLYTGDVTWPSTFIFLPDNLYTQFGRLSIIRDHYAAQTKWMKYALAKVHHGITKADTYGDWCSPPRSPKHIHSRDPKRATPGPLLASATLYQDLKLMAWYASLLHKPADQQRWLAAAAKIKAGINDSLWNARKHYYCNGSDTACILPLAAGLVPASRRMDVIRRLLYRINVVQHGHVGSGLIGGQWLFRTLTRIGQSQTAWDMLNKATYPGWGYMVKHGATTIWELWNGNTANPGMNSQDHLMLIGDMITWLFEDVGGIKSDPRDPGFHHIIMRPIILHGLTWVKTWHRSPYGKIISDWKVKPDGMFQWHVRVPANSFATAEIPAAQAGAVRLNGHKISDRPWIKFVGFINGRAIYALASGDYHFTAMLAGRSRGAGH